MASPPSSPSGSSPPQFGAQDRAQELKNKLQSHEIWNSFGFVEVGEQKAMDEGAGALFGYPMKRTKSSYFGDPGDEPYPTYKLLDNRIALLQRELVSIRRKVDGIEEDTSKTTKWGVKYTRRLTLVTNVALGIFVFATSFVRRLQLRKKVMLQSMMAANNNSSDTFNSILQEAYIQSIAASWYFYVSAICLASDTAWKRNVGIGISTIASFWAIFKSRLAWSHYLSLLSTVAYIFAEWATAERKEANVKTLKDFIGPYIEPAHSIPSTPQTSRSNAPRRSSSQNGLNRGSSSNLLQDEEDAADLENASSSSGGHWGNNP